MTDRRPRQRAEWWGTTEGIVELYKLCQIMEDKKGDVMKIGEEWDMLMEQLEALKHSFNG